MTRKAREARPKGLAQAPEKALNERQRRWAEHYAASGNALQSAIAAGYSPNSARSQSDRMLKNAEVMRYVATLTQPAEQSRIASRAERQQFWTSVMRGEPQGDEPPRFADRLKASELLGKAQADFVERHELTGQAGGPIQQETALSLEGKSIEELMALYKTWTR
ncbi:terminase small subunit [Deinococcus humi]|uniref:Terminase small subunit n=1 Tax=Deinococcus humi TaxID=662880 RepID=A0A7W8JYF7_9DEIO|nr:terminase small subunit [Deinococcus humi]MBB5364014.1 hypothetical protein [Deinococcus humi]GGO32659.1 hypothetical protein GCM10008949_30540 [Deinococcus humi]